MSLTPTTSIVAATVKMCRKFIRKRDKIEIERIRKEGKTDARGWNSPTPNQQNTVIGNH